MALAPDREEFTARRRPSCRALLCCQPRLLAVYAPQRLRAENGAIAELRAPIPLRAAEAVEVLAALRGRCHAVGGRGRQRYLLLSAPARA